MLSLYLNLDPSEFATPPARESLVHSLLDQAAQHIRGDGVDRGDRKDLEAALERARAFLENELPAEGAHAVAVFAAEPLELFEVLTLPRALPTRFAIGRSPLIAPLAAIAAEESWAVALVNRRAGRLLRGDGSRLTELADVRDDVHGQHDQGGWSQARYERSVDNEVEQHLRRVAELLAREHRRDGFDHLLVGGPREILGDFESKLESEVADRVAGRIEVDVDSATPDDVLEAMRPQLEEQEERREQEGLERLGAPLTAVGLPDVLAALNERRVEVLLIDESLSEPGGACPACGWLGESGIDTCPADGAPLEPVEDLREAAVELALGQDARVLPVRRHVERLREEGGIAALLRF